ncbi:enoyl-CoA hydratase/isomerase family protein [Halioxenophilus aromaticivorans]|uniref:3-hydroxyisobutyryl-CoA hydrolase n=1 Tax=Halioxenophilus aromaticivorans TaxID=1306992 RepID=A0AAV3TWE0_9ALTE
MSDQNAPVLFSYQATSNGNKIGIAELNAPKALNSLNYDMAQALFQQLQAWQADDSVVCVLLRGSGDKGFCAGGDVVQLHNSAVNNDSRGQEFFTLEYQLDYLIHVYPKPIVCWGHGIVMGGGLGLLSGASHRVVTEKTRLAMPEVTIGLYPDVGGSWFLNKMPGDVGLFLALTGASINAADTLFVGLADYYLNHAQWSSVLARLAKSSWEYDHHQVVTEVLLALQTDATEKPQSQVRVNFDLIQAFFAAATQEQIVENIVSYAGEVEWLSKAAATLKAGCPTTVKLVFAQLQASLHMSLKEVFQMELILSCNCLKYDNFAEGVRALLIDKDKNPQFSPATLDEVSDEFILAHFDAPWAGEHPLAGL